MKNKLGFEPKEIDLVVNSNLSKNELVEVDHAIRVLKQNRQKNDQRLSVQKS